ncbi:glycosyltransferase family 4 protein [Rubritalea sp.]|uniref:glycosyltransferase family 4 protein n=1 Tax=Rubritalea sp. TaxID=2109375 RepID=UPI003EF33CF0
MKLAIQQAVIPDYRLPLYQLLRKQYGDDFCVVCGEVDFSPTIQTVEAAAAVQCKVRNIYLLGRRLLIQMGAVKPLLQAETVVLSYNLRILSNLLVVWLRALLGKPTYLWGHIDGKSALTRRFGFLYTAFSAGFISYTESQAELLRDRKKGYSVRTAANACFSVGDCVAFPADKEVLDILFLGRLVAGKKPMLLLEAFRFARENAMIPQAAMLVIVGDGPERERLESYVEKHHISSSVFFKGHVSDKSVMGPLFGNAICCVSPGYVGLSVTQSFAYGVAVAVADDEPHSPEIEACVEGWNTQYFQSDCVKSLAAVIQSFYNESGAWLSKREEIVEWTKKTYSYEQMLLAFVACAEETSC